MDRTLCVLLRLDNDVRETGASARRLMGNLIRNSQFAIDF